MCCSCGVFFDANPIYLNFCDRFYFQFKLEIFLFGLVLNGERELRLWQAAFADQRNGVRFRIAVRAAITNKFLLNKKEKHKTKQIKLNLESAMATTTENRSALESRPLRGQEDHPCRACRDQRPAIRRADTCAPSQQAHQTTHP